ncbi:unnamed protein product [Porites lobata]|uniref:Uncharacterized protein n=1 Tax=Porites lobata TaxID=104759 RepID=A0ABN8QKW5_9CNID|nr:unnamed protein product [Porites lobata]
MKRKIDLVEEEHESEHEESESSGDESEDEELRINEEPRIKDVLSHLSRAVSVKRASDLLHSMAASKDVLFWTPSGQLLRNKRTIPVTNIAELVEYALLPHNNEVNKPRALNTFLDGLAELGIDKGLVKNKKLLSDLIEKEKGYRNVENTSDNESNNEESSSDIENQEKEEEVASENGVETEGTQERDNDTENDSEETESSSLETSITFHSKSPCGHCENSNVYSTLIMKCPKCFWHDNYKICPICDHEISEERKYIKEGFLRCHDCGLITHKNAKTLETSFYSPSKEENEEEV